MEFLPAEFPARTTGQESALAPALAGAGSAFLVEIDAVAVLDRD